MKSLIAAAAAALVLAGCATHGKFVTKMDGFIGQPESVIVGMYGPPQSSYVLGDGSRVLQYTRGRQMVLPGATTYQPVRTTTTGNMTLQQGMSLQQTTGIYSATSTAWVPQQGAPTTINLSCTVNFTIGADGVVQRWASEGNHCVAD